MSKCICQGCGCSWKGTRGDVRLAPNPFNPEDTITGCPDCDCINTIVEACDVSGCWESITCGTPTMNGFLHTCSKHRPRD